MNEAAMTKALAKIAALDGDPPGKATALEALETVKPDEVPGDLPPWPDGELPVDPGAPVVEGEAPPDLETLTGLPQIAIDAVADRVPFDDDEDDGNGFAFDLFF